MQELTIILSCPHCRPTSSQHRAAIMPEEPNSFCILQQHPRDHILTVCTVGPVTVMPFAVKLSYLGNFWVRKEGRRRENKGAGYVPVLWHEMSLKSAVSNTSAARTVAAGTVTLM